MSDTAWWLSRFCALYTYSGYLIATGEAYITNNLLVQTIFYVDTDTGVHTVDMVTWDFLSFLSLRKKKKKLEAYGCYQGDFSAVTVPLISCLCCKKIPPCVFKHMFCMAGGMPCTLMDPEKTTKNEKPSRNLHYNI